MSVKTRAVLICSAALLLVSGALAYSADGTMVEGSFGLQTKQDESLQVRLKSTAGTADFSIIALKAASAAGYFFKM